MTYFVLQTISGGIIKSLQLIICDSLQTSGKTIGLVFVVPEYGLDQVLWAREFYKAETYSNGTVYVAVSDGSIDNWFDPHDGRKISHHVCRYNDTGSFVVDLKEMYIL